jgi:hypothetical protein
MGRTASSQFPGIRDTNRAPKTQGRRGIGANADAAGLSRHAALAPDEINREFQRIFHPYTSFPSGRDAARRVRPHLLHRSPSAQIAACTDRRLRKSPASPSSQVTVFTIRRTDPPSLRANSAGVKMDIAATSQISVYERATRGRFPAGTRWPRNARAPDIESYRASPPPHDGLHCEYARLCYPQRTGGMS